MNNLIPFKTLQDELLNGSVSLVEQVENAIENINQSENLNAYIHVFEEEALKKAKQLEKKISSGHSVGQLAGMIVSVKDVIAIKNKPVTAGSKILQGYNSPFSATVIQRIQDEDAIVIGITNCDEFAMGSASQNSYYGPIKNALFPDRVSGGSSGGTAVSVAIHSCHVGIGSDTGGSIRQPAAFQNSYGYKPSYGRLSRHGLLAYASSFDQIGFISHDTAAIEKIYDITNGPDGFDSTLFPKDKVTQEPISDNIKIGCLSEAFNHKSLNEEIRLTSLRYLKQLEEDEHISISNFSFDLLDYLVQTYYILASAEASANLSRYDGIRYGYRSPEARNLEEVYTLSRTDGFGTEVKRRIMVGSFVLSSGYKDAFFAKAQRIRNKIKQRFDLVFQQYDIIALPISPVFPWKRDANLSPVEVYLSDIFSIIPNLIGSPAYQIPIGTNIDGLPIGMQFLTKQKEDHKLLNFVKYLLKTQQIR